MKRLTTLLLILTYCSCPIFAQDFGWEKLSGPYGDHILHVASNHNGVLVAASANDWHTHYLSIDNGDSWQLLDTPLTPNFPLSSFLVDDVGSIYGVNGFMLLKSNDLRTTWDTTVTTDALISGSILLANGDILLADEFQFYRSSNGGSSWDVLGDNPLNASWAHFEEDLSTGHLYLRGHNEPRIYRSDDGGVSWQLFFEEPITHLLDVEVAPNGTVFLLVDGQIWWKTATGSAWEIVDFLSDGSPSEEVVAGVLSVGTSGEIWVAANGIYRANSINGDWEVVTDEPLWMIELYNGERLFATDAGLYQYAEETDEFAFSGVGMNKNIVLDLVTDSFGRIYALNRTGLFRSVNQGRTWELTFAPENLFDAALTLSTGANEEIYLHYHNAIYKSTDFGQTFTQIPFPAAELLTGLIQEVVPHPNGDLFMVLSNGILHFDASENAWEVSLSHQEISNLHIASNHSIYVVSEAGLQRSINLGASWELMSTPVEPLWVDETNGDTLFITSAEIPVMVSFNGGLSWESSYTDSLQEISHLTSDEHGNIFGWSDANDHIIWSADQGQSWSPIPFVEEDEQDFSAIGRFFAPTDGHLYRATWFGLLRSSIPIADIVNLTGTLFLNDLANGACVLANDAIALPNQMIELEGPTSLRMLTDSIGQFSAPIFPGEYTIKADNNNVFWESCETPFTVASSDGIQDTVLEIAAIVNRIGSCPHLEVELSAAFIRRCFSNRYIVKYCNNGNATAAQVQIVVELDPFMIVDSTSVPIASQDGQTLTFEVNELSPGDCGYIHIHYTLSCSASFGQEHCIQASITPNELCVADLEDRSFDQECQDNIGSYDPNDKRAFVDGRLSEDYLPPGSALEYQIRFQNTGTDTAFTVVILDTLAAQFDVSTIRLGAASHPFQFSMFEDHILEFRFNDILLPDSTTNNAASQGFVNFSIELKEEVLIGEVISNDAAIYFDFNDPIITNDLMLMYDFPTSVLAPDNSREDQLIVFPNPANTHLYFKSLGTSEDYDILLYDIHGRLVERQRGLAPMEVSTLAGGVYLVKVLEPLSRKVVQVERVVVE
ncbi:MAG: T9SS type A sorting domain-containing protein [Bacteroidota bacterium]